MCLQPHILFSRHAVIMGYSELNFFEFLIFAKDTTLMLNKI
jgi:hypothetical protein